MDAVQKQLNHLKENNNEFIKTNREAYLYDLAKKAYQAGSEV